jgi:hypothetical protein
MNHGHNRLGLTMMKPFVIARRSVSPQDHSQSDSRVVRHRKIDELVNCDEEPPRQLLHTAARIFRRLQADPGEQGGGRCSGAAVCRQPPSAPASAGTERTTGRAGASGERLSVSWLVEASKPHPTFPSHRASTGGSFRNVTAKEGATRCLNAWQRGNNRLSCKALHDSSQF